MDDSDYGDYASLLDAATDALRVDGSPMSLSVRELLWYFGAQRRGYAVVERLRDGLAEFGLRTDPDFESAYIDSEISLVFETPSVDGRTEQGSEGEPSDAASGQAEGPPTSTYDDPAYRISKLAAASNIPTSVPPDAWMQEAVTVMLTHGFSQLPVMTNERDVKGVISWLSLGTRLALGKPAGHVRDFMDVHRELPDSASIFQAIPIVSEFDYVLVRSDDRRISGIITASDLSIQLQQLTEPFLLLGEIEKHVRHVIRQKLSLSGVAIPTANRDDAREISSVNDLNFGEYILILEDISRWNQLFIPLDRILFCQQLDRCRLIRNSVMHFDTDALPGDDLLFLRKVSSLLQRLHLLGLI